jgi:hypothetical protein
MARSIILLYLAVEILLTTFVIDAHHTYDLILRVERGVLYTLTTHFFSAHPNKTKVPREQVWVEIVFCHLRLN